MSFIDRVEVRVSAGSGGSGCVSFRREAFVPKGGPDGGDGGKGGSVFVTGDPSLTTLLDYKYHTHWKVKRAGHGRGSNKTGKSTSDLHLPVPLGTEVHDAETGELIGEVVQADQVVMVARGGRGGRGNAQFATPTHRAPTESEPGKVGERRRIELVLKLIADVGLLGEPNAGKSTLLSVITAARPKIADYPFTTLNPNLGVVGLSGGRSFVVADIPGIIEGAHEGKGLGHQFLQHIERTRVLAYLIPVDAEDLQDKYALLRSEVREYSGKLAAKPHLVALTKADLLPSEAGQLVVEAPESSGTYVISAVAGKGLNDLQETLWELLQGSAEQAEAGEVGEPTLG